MVKKSTWAILLSILLVSCILSAVGYFVYTETAKRYHSSREIFRMSDPAGDDFGPGSYQYPTDSIFDPKSGHFDLVEFVVYLQKGKYYFDLKFGEVTNPWGAAEGFSHQICQIYIADGSENGSIETFKEGANVQFSPKNPWTALVKIVSFGKTAVYSAADYETSQGKFKAVTAELQPDNKTVRVTVPEKYLSGNPYKWSYYVLVGSQDGSGPDNYRPVFAAPSQWNFGGGGTRYHPNVLDMLAPEDGPNSQKSMLGSFNPEEGRQALLHSVGPSGYEPSAWEEFLEYMESTFISYGIEL